MAGFSGTCFNTDQRLPVRFDGLYQSQLFVLLHHPCRLFHEARAIDGVLGSQALIQRRNKLVLKQAFVKRAVDLHTRADQLHSRGRVDLAVGHNGAGIPQMGHALQVMLIVELAFGEGFYVTHRVVKSLKTCLKYLFHACLSGMSVHGATTCPSMIHGDVVIFDEFIFFVAVFRIRLFQPAKVEA
jgi:hypothetical protein